MVETAKPGRRRWVRWTLLAVGTLVVVVLVIALLLPTLLSSGPGAGFVASRISATIPGSVDIGDLSLGWFSGQEIGQLRLLDPEGQLVAEVERVALPEASLLGLLTGSMELGAIAVDRPWADIVQAEDGTTNLGRALGTEGPAAEDQDQTPEEPGPAGEEPGLVPADLSLALKITDGEVRYRAPGIEVVTATIPQVAMEMLSPQLITFDLQTALQQGQDRGSIRAEGRLERLFDARGRLDFEGADVNAEARVVDLPLPVVDRIAGTGEKPLAVLLGRTLSAEASAKGTMADMSVRLVANAPNAEADVDARVTPDRVRTAERSTAQLTLEPEAFTQWTGSPATLLEPVTINVQITDLVTPLRDGEPVLAETTGQVSLQMQDARLEAPGVGPVAIRGTSAQASLQSGKATLSADTTIAQQQSTGTLSLRGEASDLFNMAGEVDLQGAAVDATLTARDLPLDAIDRIAGLNGQLADLLGPTLQVEAVARGRWDDLRASLTASAQRLSADLAIVADPQRITGRDGGVGQVRLTVPADVATRMLADPEAQGAQMTVTEPIAITLQIPRLSVPLQDGVPQPMRTSVEATLAAEPTTLDVPGVGAVRLADMAARITTPGLADRLEAQLNATTRVGNEQGRVALTATATNLLDANDELAMDAANLDATLAASDVPVAVVDQLAGQDGVLTALLGPRLAVDATARGQVADFAATVTARSQHMAADLSLAATPQRLTGGEGGAGTIRLAVTPDAAKQLQAGSEDMIVPESPMNLALRLPTLSVPMRDGEPVLGDAQLAAEMALEPVALQVPQVGRVQVQRGTAGLRSDGLAQGLSVTIEADTVAADRPGSLAATARITELVGNDGELNTEQYVAAYTLNTTDLPVVAMLDAMLDQKGLLVTATGPSVTASAKGTWRAAQGGGPIEATVAAGPNRVDLQGLVQADRIAVDQADATITVTPELFRRLMTPEPAESPAAPQPPAAPAMVLTKPVAMKLTVDQAVLPTDMSPGATSLTAKLTAEPFVFQPTGTTVPIILSDLNLAIAAPALDKPIRLTASGNLPTPDNVISQPAPAPGNAPGSAPANQPAAPAGLRSTSTLHLAFGPDQELDLGATRLQTDTTVSQFPIALIDQFAQAEVRLVPILGPVASVQLRGDFPGVMNLQARSATAAASVVGELRQEQLTPEQLAAGREPQIVLNLQEDLRAQLMITPEMVTELMGRMHPMFQDAVASESPVRLTVSRQSGGIPLTGLDLTRATLLGQLDAGQVRMRRGGWLQETVSFVTGQLAQGIGLNRSPQRNVELDTYIATFTPMDFSLRDGILAMPETWVTSRDLAIGFVGSVDLTNPEAPQIQQMRMGILQASLIVEAPRLGDFLQADQVAELPLVGSISSPEPMYDTLIKDLVGSGLVQTARERGGEAGAILGTIFEGFGQAAREKRSQRTGVSWNPPAPAQELIARARNAGREPQQPQPTQQPGGAQPPASQQPAPDQSAPQEPAQPQSPPKSPADLLRDLLGGERPAK